jgi:hypothetical protein
MGHPSSRSERRFVRTTHIQKRLHIIKHGWGRRTDGLQPGRYSKWHLSCGALMCHADKHFTAKRRRRVALSRDIVENIVTWQEIPRRFPATAWEVCMGMEKDAFATPR